MRKFLYILAGLLGLIALVVPSYFLGKKHYGAPKNNKDNETNTPVNIPKNLNIEGSLTSYHRGTIFYPFEGEKEDCLTITFNFDFSNFENAYKTKINNFYLTNLQIFSKSNNHLLASFNKKVLFKNNIYIQDIEKSDYDESAFPIENEYEEVTPSENQYAINASIEVNPTSCPDQIDIFDGKIKESETTSSKDVNIKVDLENKTGLTINKVNGARVRMMCNYKITSTDEIVYWSPLTDIVSLTDSIVFSPSLKNNEKREYTFVFPYGKYNEDIWNSTNGYELIYLFFQFDYESIE